MPMAYQWPAHGPPMACPCTPERIPRFPKGLPKADPWLNHGPHIASSWWTDGTHMSHPRPAPGRSQGHRKAYSQPAEYGCTIRMQGHWQPMLTFFERSAAKYRTAFETGVPLMWQVRATPIRRLVSGARQLCCDGSGVGASRLRREISGVRNGALGTGR